MMPRQCRRSKSCKGECAKARSFWRSLQSWEKWELGDQLVWGSVDYDYWFGEKRPSKAFLRELDKERLYWECKQ